MLQDGSLWAQGYEKVKTIQRNIFQSPIDQQKLYFEIERRLTIAEEIRQDIKQAYEQAAQQDQRVKFSRIKPSLRHFQKNCAIEGIPEVDKLQKQVKLSREALQNCESLIEQPDKLHEVREQLLTKVLIDLEKDEIPVKKELFERTIKNLQKVPYSTFRQLEKDYLKLKHWLSKVGL